MIDKNALLKKYTILIFLILKLITIFQFKSRPHEISDSVYKLVRLTCYAICLDMHKVLQNIGKKQLHKLTNFSAHS